MGEEIWYYGSDGQRRGPYTMAQLRQFAVPGLLRPSDLVWSGDAQNAMPATSVPGLLPPPVPAEGGASGHPQAGGEPPQSGDKLLRLRPAWRVAVAMASFAFIGAMIADGGWPRPVLTIPLGGALAGMIAAITAWSSAPATGEGRVLIAGGVLTAMAAAALTVAVRHTGLSLAIALPVAAAVGVLFRKRLSPMGLFE